MTLQARTVLNLIAGAVGGFLAWAVIDLTGWFTSLFASGAVIVQFQPNWWLQILLGGIVGGFIGFLLGIVNAMGDDSAQRRLIGTSVHSSIGFAGGTVGLMIGQTFWAILAPRSAGLNVAPSPTEFVQELIARAVGWAFIGAGIGLAQGVARRSSKLTRQGLFGGFVGGLIGGILFETSATIIQSPSIARLLGFVSIGATTGFFIGLIQTLFRQAWIRVVLGRNEGKEYLLDKPVTVIGRSELADICLFGNPNISPHQCAIEQIGGRFRLVTTPHVEAAQRGQLTADVKVNGQVVNPDVWLADGDSISIEDRTLLFREKLVRQAETPVVNPPREVSLRPKTASVTIVDGPEVGKTFFLAGNKYQVGRTDDCEISLKSDTLISRRHAVIGRIGATWSITDNNSANGTFVNGEQLESSSSRTLSAGDRIKVGESELVVDITK